MKQPIRYPVLTITVLMTFTGCTTRDAKTASHIEADEAAIRRTLATSESRINSGDLGFIDVFTKDAIIIAPSSPDIVGLEAIRAMYSTVQSFRRPA
jgi:hypothetical protein